MTDEMLNSDTTDFADDGMDDDFEFDFFDEGDEGYDESEVGDSGTSSGENPWAKFEEAGVKPEDAWKTWDKFTQNSQTLAEERRQFEARMRELEPIERLKDEIMSDPGLVAVIDEYMNNPGRQSKSEVIGLKQQVSSLQMQMETDREYGELMDYVNENNFPKVSKREIVEYAIDHKVGNLMAAYRDMKFDELREREVEKFANDVKRSRGAKSVTKAKKDKPTKRLSITDMATLPDDEFERAYGAAWASATE